MIFGPSYNFYLLPLDQFYEAMLDLSEPPGYGLVKVQNEIKLCLIYVKVQNNLTLTADNPSATLYVTLTADTSSTTLYFTLTADTPSTTLYVTLTANTPQDLENVTSAADYAELEINTRMTNMNKVTLLTL